MNRFTWVWPTALGVVALVAYLVIRFTGPTPAPEQATPMTLEPTTAGAAAPMPVSRFAFPSLAAPVAAIEPKVLELHGFQRTDNYYWLRDKERPETIAYLEAENAYANEMLAPLKDTASALAAEMRDRMDDADQSVPFLDNGYVYEARIAEGADYPVIVRRKNAPDAAEEMVLDVPKLAEGHAQYNLNTWEVSPDGTLVAYAVDFAGDRMHQIFVQEIATGTVIESAITGASSDVVWAADNKTLFYVKSDPVTVRDYQVWRHALGAATDTDALVYEEKDETFSVGVSQSKSRRYIFIASNHYQRNEIRLLRADNPSGEFTVMEPRRAGLIYSVDHVGDTFYILTNLDAPDFRLMRASETAFGAGGWIDVVPERPGVILKDFEAFDRYITLDEEHDAIVSLRVINRETGADVAVPRPQEIGMMSTSDFGDAVNLDPSSDVVRFGFTAPTTPETIYDFNMATGELKQLRQDPAVKWLDASLYKVERIQAPATDGTLVPVTLIYRPDRKLPGGNPTLVVGYGAYGISYGLEFTPTWFSLIDRGFVYAIAHVRGGAEMGRRWYDQGRMFEKRNTFTDFIAAGEALVAQGYADKSRLFARGGSAGGLLVGAVANMRPDLFAGIVAEVPFVDAITTMSDATIPLTTFEWEEWGNPGIKEQYHYMMSYSPYDNVEAKAYPALFVTAGLNDSQVGYFEPAKWVARLRATKTDTNPILFLTEMDAGHAGDSGRFGIVEERSKIMAWLLALSGLAPSS